MSVKPLAGTHTWPCVACGWKKACPPKGACASMLGLASLAAWVPGATLQGQSRRRLSRATSRGGKGYTTQHCDHLCLFRLRTMCVHAWLAARWTGGAEWPQAGLLAQGVLGTTVCFLPNHKQLAEHECQRLWNPQATGGGPS